MTQDIDSMVSLYLVKNTPDSFSGVSSLQENTGKRTTRRRQEAGKRSTKRRSKCRVCCQLFLTWVQGEEPPSPFYQNLKRAEDKLRSISNDSRIGYRIKASRQGKGEAA